MAQWTFRSGSAVTAGSATGDALVVNRPVGYTSGDKIVYLVYWESDTNIITGPSGFVKDREIANTGAFILQLWSKIGGGSEPTTYTFTPGTNGQFRSILGVCYQNGTSNAVDQTSAAQGDSTIITSQLAPSVTTTGVNRLLLFGYANFSGAAGTGTTGAASNFRQEFAGMIIADAAIASASATGTTGPTGGSIGSEDFACMHVAYLSDPDGGLTPIPDVENVNPVRPKTKMIPSGLKVAA